MHLQSLFNFQNEPLIVSWPLQSLLQHPYEDSYGPTPGRVLMHTVPGNITCLGSYLFSLQCYAEMP